MTGRTHDLQVEKTTVGRLEDNLFAIPEPSVSSHHCELIVQGDDVLVRDLNSTNGTFINGEKVTEAVLKPGQTLRLGQIEMRLEKQAPAPGSIPPPPAAPDRSSTSPAKKPADQTLAMKRGVSLEQLEHGGSRTGGFDTASKGFSKKDDKASRVFWIAAGIFGFLILVALAYVFLIASK